MIRTKEHNTSHDPNHIQVKRLQIDKHLNIMAHGKEPTNINIKDFNSHQLEIGF